VSYLCVRLLKLVFTKHIGGYLIKIAYKDYPEAKAEGNRGKTSGARK